MKQSENACCQDVPRSQTTTHMNVSCTAVPAREAQRPSIRTSQASERVSGVATNAAGTEERSGSSQRVTTIKSEKFTYRNEASCECWSEEAGGAIPDSAADATAVWRAVRSKAPRLVVAVAMGVPSRSKGAARRVLE
jgi:hypothetical protein